MTFNKVVLFLVKFSIVVLTHFVIYNEYEKCDNLIIVYITSHS